jgi:hypothetical protein
MLFDGGQPIEGVADNGSFKFAFISAYGGFAVRQTVFNDVLNFFGVH